MEQETPATSDTGLAWDEIIKASTPTGRGSVANWDDGRVGLLGWSLEISIADMALFGWARSAGYAMGDRGLADHPHLQAFVARIKERPAVQRALALRERHAFKIDLHAAARRAMFPWNGPVA